MTPPPMTYLPEHAPLEERIAEGRKMARDGYGAEDVSIACRLSIDRARDLVMEAEYTRVSRTKDARP